MCGLHCSITSPKWHPNAHYKLMSRSMMVMRPLSRNRYLFQRVYPPPCMLAHLHQRTLGFWMHLPLCYKGLSIKWTNSLGNSSPLPWLSRTPPLHKWASKFHLPLLCKIRTSSPHHSKGISQIIMMSFLGHTEGLCLMPIILMSIH